jgi:hypothetical protein
MKRARAAPAILLLVGCSQARSVATAELNVAIVGGEPSPAADDGVVLLRARLEDNAENVCSASLVAPNLLLTARHCVSLLVEGQFDCSVRGEVFDNPTGGGTLGLHLPAESLEVYGGKLPRAAPLALGQQVISTLSQTICVNDLAFVVLDRSLNLPILPLRLGRGAELNEPGDLIGYGLDGKQVAIDVRSQPRQRTSGSGSSGLAPILWTKA